VSAGPRLAEGLARVVEVLAAEYGCAPGDLAAAGVRVVERPPSRSSPLARRYPPYDPAIGVVSLGPGAVVAASRPLLREAEKIFAGANREESFDSARISRASALLAPHGLAVYGPSPRLVCGSERFRERPAPPGVSIEVVRDPAPERIAALEPGRFRNAFSPRRTDERPTRVLALAHVGGEVVGAAAVSDDCDTLWQIGIDVEPRAQGRGIAPALTSVLARAILDTGRTPYYQVATANLASLRTALAVGFTPAWVEVFTGTLL
jgi:hypothetical protein